MPKIQLPFSRTYPTMFGPLRTALSLSRRPRTLVLAAVVAVAAVASGIVADAVAARAYAAAPSASLLFYAPLAVEVVVSAAAWIPVAAFVLAGFYATVDDEPRGLTESLRAFARSGRGAYRRYLVGATAAFVVTLALTAALWALFVAGYLAASTGFDYLRYAGGARFAANPLWGVAATGILLALAGLVAAAAVVFTGPLLVRSDVDAPRAPLASVRTIRESPRVALPAAAVAALLFALPEVATWVAFLARTNFVVTPTGEHPLPARSATTVTLLAAFVATFLAYALAGPLLVTVTDRAGKTGPAPSLDALIPGKRVAALALVVLLVGSAATAVRVADAKPHDPPAASVDLDQAPGDVYAASLDLTRQTSRRVNASVLTAYPNGTLEQRVSFVTAWDAADAQTRLWTHLPEGDTASAYFSQRVTAFRHAAGPVGRLQAARTPATRRTNGWVVAAVPMHDLAASPDHVGPRESFRRTDIPLRVVERTPDRLVLGVDGEPAAELSPFHAADRYEVRNASFRAVVDPDTGYLQRIRLETTVHQHAANGTVVERRQHARVVTYEDVGTTDVTRPEIGDPSALEYLWDVLWY